MGSRRTSAHSSTVKSYELRTKLDQDDKQRDGKVGRTLVSLCNEVLNLAVEDMPAARKIAVFHHNIECGGVGWPNRKVTTSQKAKK